MKRTYTLLLVILTFLGLWLYLALTYPTASPLKSASYMINHFLNPHLLLKKESIGFLPYWQVSNSKYILLDSLTELNYFGLVVDNDGQFLKVVNNQTDPGWYTWNSQIIKDLIAQAQIMGCDFSLSIVSQKNSIIRNILDNKDAQARLIANIIDQVKSRHLNGINIDFEYSGKADDKYRNEFTNFSKNLVTSLKKQDPNIQLSVSIMPLSAREKDIFDFPKLLNFYDKFIGMSYDYYGLTSDIAGPTAPINGFLENKYFFDITTTYQDYLKYIPRNKIIMGIPYYGWDWAVVNGAKIQSKTLPISNPNNYAAVISYARARTDKDLLPTQCQFDDYALQPWCWYTDKKTGVDHHVWFENNKSIEIKYDFAKKQNLLGVAIWTLGYDKDYSDLWDIMKNKLGKN